MPDAKYFRAIYGCARELGLSNDDVHDAAFVGFGKTSLKELTDAECRQLLDGMRGKKMAPSYERRQAQSQAGRKRVDRESPGYGTEFMVNGAEMQMLRAAAELRGWSEETLQAFIQRQLKHPIRTMRDLNKVFWAIKAMNRRDHLVGPNDVPVQHAS